MISTDKLQNEVLTIAHHLDDIEKAIRKGDSGYALEGIKDAKEAIDRLNKFLPSGMKGELGRMAEGKISAIAGMITEDPDVFSENPALGMAASKVAGDAIDKVTDSGDSDDSDIDDDIAEGHHYLRKTSRSKEKELQRANERAARASGLPGYERLNSKRKDMIDQIEQSRPLRRSEFINKYGYEAWLQYAEENGLPENHKWADAGLGNSG